MKNEIFITLKVDPIKKNICVCNIGSSRKEALKGFRDDPNAEAFNISLETELVCYNIELWLSEYGFTAIEAREMVKNLFDTMSKDLESKEP